MTIVCATHFTDSSFAAVKAAASLASTRKEKLCLVTVVPDSSSSSWRREEFVDDALKLELSSLAALNLTTECEILHGSLNGTVQAYCAKHGASLLVIGDASKSKSALFALPLDTLLSTVDVPMLVVRDAKPFDAWGHGRAPLKVLLAIDHTWSSAVACNWISQLAEYGPISLVASFLWWPADEYARRNTPPQSEDQGHAALASMILKDLKGALSLLPSNVTTRVHLEIGHDGIAEKLLAFAGEEQVDVLVLGSHPHNGPLARMRSISHGVIVEAPMSVACIPSRIARAPAAVPKFERVGPHVS